MKKRMTATNNKGFSLVELIIVIAIMAVLVGLLAPQFIKYVEQSKESSDIANIQAITTAIEVAYVDPAIEVKGGTISFTTSPVPVGTAVTGTELQNVLTTAGIKTIQAKSALYSAGSPMKITVTLTPAVNNGAPVFTSNNTDLNTAMGWAATP